MGEAGYYLIAVFDDEKSAETAMNYAKYILMDLAKFEEDWQNIRMNRAMPVKERHKMLLKKHPLTAKYIKLPRPVESDRSMNYLAGECEMDKDFELEREGNQIRLYAYVWHMASWDNVRDLFYKLGAKVVDWMSDEYVDIFDILEDEISDTVKPPDAPEPLTEKEMEKLKFDIIASGIKD